MSKSNIITKIGLCILLVLLADGLFYKQPVGWTAGLYAGLLLAVLRLLNRQLLQTIASKIIGFATVGLIVALIEAPQFLTMLLISLGIITLLILQKRNKLACALLWLNDVGAFLTQGFGQWYKDVHKVERASKRKTGKKIQLSYALIPVSLTLLFGFLFAQANPIIAQVFDGIDWEFLLRLISVWRWSFWIITGIIVWALLRPRFLLCDALTTGKGINLEGWLNAQTLVLCLVLFNSLFALQNGLDVLFLWSSETLPNGLSYADYAHGGSYPLLATSLITAVFVLITFNEHQPHYQTALAKKLVFIWLVQNVFLQLSAIDRLLHYIEVYSLTYLRIVALIGIALTAIGMMLIFARIYTNRSNVWLINSNALAIAATLYITCFINMDSLIANYNVRHALEVTGQGTSIDLPYLRDLGSECLPALRWFQANAKYSPSQTAQAGGIIAELENELATSTTNWRAWTWRKQRQLAIKAAPTQAVPIGDSGWQFHTDTLLPKNKNYE
jgi:hypothetical protein